MVEAFKKFDFILMKILSAIVIFTNLAVTGLILFLVIARYVLGWSVVGVLDLATISALWLYMCGAVVAARNREHLVVDFLEIKLANTKMGALHRLAVSIIMVVLSIFFLSLVRDMLGWSIKRPQTTAELSIPLLVPQAAIVVAAVFCSVYAVRDAVVAVYAYTHYDDTNTKEI